MVHIYITIHDKVDVYLIFLHTACRLGFTNVYIVREIDLKSKLHHICVMK